MSVDYMAAAPPAPITGLPRLIPADPATDHSLAGHLARLGPVPHRGDPRRLIGVVEAAGLTGRGGAAFPVHRKLAAVAGQARDRRRAVVVANGAEGEPASGKDAALLWGAPHLVLDGLQLAAQATGATEAFLYVHRGEELSRRLLGAHVAAEPDAHLAALPVPSDWRSLDAEAVVAATRGDKKRHAGGTQYVLLDAIGHSTLDDGVHLDDVRAVLAEIGLQ